MTKRGRTVIIATLTAVLLVAGSGSPAYALDGGARTYTWPKHACGSTPMTITIYMHTWWYVFGQYSKADGRLHYHSGTCSLAASHIEIQDITLWFHSNGQYYDVAHSGFKDLDVTSGDAVWSSRDITCVSGRTYHVEVRYNIEWKDGTISPQRDNNSYNYTTQGATNDCAF
jgi:hypothetical protein